ncbi:hypothetical protein ACS8FA_14715, partial [Psychrobacter sp. 1Y1]|uniref:hypothetical protein n=1 Tax=Psychrobacter sp. 1Y1 TaxID=3453574 RepID=UPI003F46E37F
MNELLNLVNIVATPLVVFVLPILMFLYKYRHSDNKDISFIKYSCTFDATHGLARQPLFWVAIVYPIGLFFFTGLYAWAGTNFDISATGFNQFIEISKLPLGLLALSLPLAVLTARLHGTKQTAMQIQKTEQQIKEAQQKNKTDLYLAHYKHFCEHIDSILEIIELDY